MKHLIETVDLSGLTRVDYNRIILASATNEIVYRGGYEYVDLGLPSRLKWAKCNIGAEKETDYGDYFMYGSTEPNTADECTWAKAPFNDGSSDYNETYFNSVKDTVCPNGILAKVYDAAAQIMGGDWRMPTKTEFQELLDYTNHEWTIINGVKGRKFTSKADKSKYIFIPAAGFCSNGSVNDVGSYCLVWSSSLDGDGAWGLLSYPKSYYMSTRARYGGLSVRGVRA